MNNTNFGIARAEQASYWQNLKLKLRVENKKVTTTLERTD